MTIADGKIIEDLAVRPLAEDCEILNRKLPHQVNKLVTIFFFDYNRWPTAASPCSMTQGPPDPPENCGIDQQIETASALQGAGGADDFFWASL